MDRVRLAVVLEDVARLEFRQDDMDERDANGAFVGVVPTGDGVGQPVDRERWFTRREHVEGETRPGVREERVRLVERDVREPNESLDIDDGRTVWSRHRKLCCHTD